MHYIGKELAAPSSENSKDSRAVPTAHSLCGRSSCLYACSHATVCKACAPCNAWGALVYRVSFDGQPVAVISLCDGQPCAVISPYDGQPCAVIMSLCCPSSSMKPSETPLLMALSTACAWSRIRPCALPREWPQPWQGEWSGATAHGRRSGCISSKLGH